MRPPGWFSGCASILLVFSLVAPQWTAPAASQASPFQTFAPFWMEGHGFETTIILRNIRRTLAAQVKPILYTTVGRQISLASLNLPADSVREIALRDLLNSEGVNASSGALALESETPGPAVTPTAPYTWIQVKTADGSTAYIPVWK